MLMDMFTQLAVATAMVLLTVVTHGFGLTMLSGMLRGEQIEESKLNIPPLSLRGLTFTLGVVLGLFALHGVEIWAYAFLFDFVHALPDMEQALYFSTISYAAVGYDNAGVAQAWRIVGAIEGINGVILLGWSTAFFVRFLSRISPTR